MAYSCREKTPRFAPLCASDSCFYADKQRKIVPLCQSHPEERKHTAESHGKLPDTLDRAIKTYHRRPSTNSFREFTHYAFAQDK